MEFLIHNNNRDLHDHLINSGNKSCAKEQKKKLIFKKDNPAFDEQLKMNKGNQNETNLSNKFRTNYSDRRVKSNKMKHEKEHGDSNLKNTKKFVFLKEIANKIENNYEDINLKLEAPKIAYNQSVNMINAAKNKTNNSFNLNTLSYSQFFPVKRNSKIDRFSEEEFQKTVDYIQNFSLTKISNNKKHNPSILEVRNNIKLKLKIPNSSENSRYSKSKSKKHSEMNSPLSISYSESNSDAFTKITKNNKSKKFFLSISNSNANSNSKSDFSKQTYHTNNSTGINSKMRKLNPSQDLKQILSKKGIVKSFKNINNNKNKIKKVKSQNELEEEDKITLNHNEDNFKRIQDKMQNLINSKLQKKGECYIPNLKSLIKMNNYIIRDFNVGGNSTVNSKRNLFLTKQYKNIKENELKKKAEKFNNLISKHNIILGDSSQKKLSLFRNSIKFPSYDREMIMEEHEKQKSLMEKKEFKKVNEKSKKLCDLLLENRMPPYKSIEDEDDKNFGDGTLKNNLIRCAKVRNIIKFGIDEQAELIGFASIQEFKKQKIENDLEMLTRLKNLGYPKFLKTEFKKETLNNFYQISGKYQGRNEDLNKILEKYFISNN